MTRGTWLGGCTLLSILSLTWQIMQHQSIPHLLDSDTLAKTSNVMIYDLQYRQYDTKGRMVHFLETPLMQHIPKHNQHLLTTPHIITNEVDQSPWDISAKEATAIEGTQKVTFHHNVNIRQEKADHSDTLLHTEQLIYFPHQKKATSNAEVTLTQAENQVQSKGLEIDLATSHVRLLSNARGHYVPKKG